MLENRPILVITIGYIIGIIMGLYCKINIALIFIIIYILKKLLHNKKKEKKFKLISIERYSRYFKIVFTKKVKYIIVVFAIISNTITINQNKKYDQYYDKNVSKTGIVISNPIEKEYKYVYKVKLKDRQIYLNVKKDKKIKLEYGDKIQFTGKFETPKERSNYRGFDYKEYLKTIGICGTVELEKCEILSKNNNLRTCVNKIFLKVKNKIENNFPKDISDVFLGLVFGYNQTIDEDLKEQFNQSNITYILAVSGMHVAILVLAVKKIFEKISGKREAKFVSILIIVFYMYLTELSNSVVRAGMMANMTLLAGILFKKSDVWQNLSISMLILLIKNPFAIKDMSLILSFTGTIGILIFQKTIFKILNKSKEAQKTTKKIIKEATSMTISAQIMVSPIIMICYNTVSITSILISVFVSLILTPILILCYIYCITPLKIPFLENIIEFSINILIKVSELGSKLPFNQIYVTTPNLISIIIYYLFIIIINFIININFNKNLSTFQKRIKNLISLTKYKINQNKPKVKFTILIMCILIVTCKIIPQNLRIFFIDVGQGDSCLILTPNNKSILIDGGGSENFDVGKNVLFPYLFDRTVRKIDYMVISHFDTDHVRTDYCMCCKK